MSTFHLLKTLILKSIITDIVDAINHILTNHAQMNNTTYLQRILSY